MPNTRMSESPELDLARLALENGCELQGHGAQLKGGTDLCFFESGVGDRGTFFAVRDTLDADRLMAGESQRLVAGRE